MEHTYWTTILHYLHNFDKTKRKVFDIFGGNFNWQNRNKNLWPLVSFSKYQCNQYCSTTRKCKWKSTKGSIKHSHLFTCNEDPSCQGHLAHDVVHVHITQTQHAKDMAWNKLTQNLSNWISWNIQFLKTDYFPVTFPWQHYTWGEII